MKSVLRAAAVAALAPAPAAALGARARRDGDPNCVGSRGLAMRWSAFILAAVWIISTE